ncbi:MFS transporter [Intrasporangium sp.]|uniref:MFS transporter n=1 Tax=Intrasporangium sp. TaxID=1925024 RepID=UPI0032216A92
MAYLPEPTRHPGQPRPLPSFWTMVVALLAVAVNLRVAITSVPPLIDTISADLGLSHAMAGVLTALPVLCMGLFAPLAGRLAERAGAAVVVLCSAVGILLGTIARGLGDNVALLYLGTFVAGVGIAVASTLLPQLVKIFFPPQRMGLVTGLYMAGMLGGATLASAVAVPLAERLGSWQASLGAWAVLALLGVLVWAPFTVRVRARHVRGEGPHGGLPWRSLTAWTVAIYLALQSWCFYSSVAWLAPSYVEHGWSKTAAGYLLAAFTAAQIVSGLLGPALSDRVRDMRVLLLVSAALGIVGSFGIYLAPLAAPWVWAFVLGLGQGAAFSLGLVLLVHYARTPSATARLSGMGFLVCYLLASFGPLAMGAVRDRVGNLTLTWPILGFVGIAQALVALRLRPNRAKVR